MSRLACTILIAAWCAATAWGSWKALDYQMAAATVAPPPEMWPTECQLERPTDRSTLVLFIHPKCPCTRATLRQVDRLLAHHQHDVKTYVICLKPDSAPFGWEQTDLLETAKALPGVQVMFDEHDRYHQMFRMSTSGEMLLYGATGRLQFHGGITAGRGHEGDSTGSVALSALLHGKETSFHATPVFGCALKSQKRCCETRL